jgi:hypothetical protein
VRQETALISQADGLSFIMAGSGLRKSFLSAGVLTSASNLTSTSVANAANCPLSNGTVYTSSATNSGFLISCDYDILPVGGSYISVASQVEYSLDYCLDYYASYNQNETNAALEGCVAAAWVIFSATPVTNERCYLNNEKGVISLGSANG